MSPGESDATDPLTGLRRRDGLRDELDASPSVCCLVDIDGLIWLNDQHGHAEGDRVLAVVAKHLMTSLGERARSIFRVAGDDFLVVLRDGSSDAPRQIAAEIVAGVRALEIPYRRRDRPLRTTLEVNAVILPATLALSLYASPKLELRDWLETWIYLEKVRKGSEAGVVVDLSSPTSVMTVGRLKQVLGNVPDDVIVTMVPSPRPEESPRPQAAWPTYRGGPVLAFQPARRLSDEFLVQDLIGITGRGTAILVDSLADGRPGQQLTVEITRPDGSAFTTAASLELASWRSETPLESPAFVVSTKMREIPFGSKLRVIDAG